MIYIMIMARVLFNYGIAIGSSIYLGNVAIGRRNQFRKFLVQFCMLYVLFVIPFFVLGENPLILIFSYILAIIGLCGILSYKGQNSIVKCLGVSQTSFIFVFMVVKSFFITGRESMFNHIVSVEHIKPESIIISLIADVAIIVFVRVVRKKQLYNFFDRIYVNNSKTITILESFFIGIWLFIMQYVSRNTETDGYEGVYLVTVFTFVCGFMMLLVFMVVYYRIKCKNEKISLQEVMINQQKIYISNLESLQKEVKRFQHDYKNIVAGLYISESSDGNNATVKYLEENIYNFDKKLSQSIKKTTNLNHIKIDEIKGIILAKSVKANELEINLIIESIKDVNNVFIHIADFNRCMGILIDNGMDAAEKSLEKEVRVTMFQEEDKFTLIVKNSYLGELNLNHIWESGYSEKGKNRGYGLSNYLDIIGKYPNIVKETFLEEKYFVQVLKIFKEVKG